ncbi:hypothetical protein [Xanthomonas campestris]|uniref:hypothetical protein n=1 Tax=Xanthomonas campestris TaxID=339 RepID=UPI0011C01F38|nr:hypothetical protein [Xanthomonas campestris]MEA9576922.1 hypothetical protein [Xanthomonas campestris]
MKLKKSKKIELKKYWSIHMAQPDVSPSEYFNTKRLQLSNEVFGKKKFYLDTCYWVYLREASLGKPRRPEYIEILARLRDLVASQKVVCPISDAIYIESMQHADLNTRLATAVLFDELSGGVCLRTEKERVANELRQFTTNPAEPAPLKHSPHWVKPGMVLGAGTASPKSLDPINDLIFRKVTIDLLWETSFTELAHQPKGDGFNLAMEESAQRINSKIIKYSADIRSFQHAFASELSGLVSLYDSEMARSFLAERLPGFTADDVIKFTEFNRTLLFNTFRLKPELMAQRVPTLYIQAATHAAIRWDKARRLNGHWIMDIHHACAACGSHDAMLTETPLKILMTSGNLNFHKKFDINIISDAEAALSLLRNI